MSENSPTQEEIEEMRAIVAAADAQRAAELAAAREARFQPLRALVTSPAFAEVLDETRRLIPLFRDEFNVDIQLRPLPDFMERLKFVAD